jgi:hypothetical protein
MIITTLLLILNLIAGPAAAAESGADSEAALSTLPHRSASVAWIYLPIVNSPLPLPQFVKSSDSPYYVQYYSGSGGCDWMGVAGEVLHRDGQPVAPDSYLVRITGGGIDAFVPVGSEPAYGPSGWQQFLFDSPVVRSYEIRLWRVDGAAASPLYSFESRAACDQNLVRFDFVELDE